MKLDIERFDSEWLENSKVSVRYGIQKFAIPLIYAFMISDFIYAKERIWLLFCIRTFLAISVLVFVHLLQNTKTKSQFLNWYFVVCIWFSYLIYLLAFLIYNDYNAFPIAILVVVVGAFAFISVPLRYYFTILFIVYLPFSIIAGYHLIKHIEPTALWIELCNVGCILVIYSLAIQNLARFQTKEFESRMALNHLLEERDGEISKLIGELTDLKLHQAELVKKEEAFNLARQVAHDIRAPISALNVATRKLYDSSSELAEFIDSCSKRINDISDNMLNRSRQALADQNKLYAADLIKIIRAIVEEKKMAVIEKDKSKRIGFEVELPSTPISARVFEADFSRAFSNILENSIDAISSRGTVEVRCNLDKSKNQICIQIRDNGRGIPQEIMRNVGRYGFTFGKPNGSGLGLAYAFNVAQSAGGSISIESEPGKFTTITMCLPQGDSLS